MRTDAFGPAFEPFADELSALLPDAAAIFDAHTHLGADEDGRTQDLATLLASLDTVGSDARACVFPLHDPERRPGYRLPNDRVLAWAVMTGLATALLQYAEAAALPAHFV